MSQTSINPAGQPVGIAGMDYDSGEGKDVVSFFVEGSTSIPFGCAVQQGSTEKSGKVLDGSGNTVIGINVWGYNHMPGTDGDLDTTGLKTNSSGQLGRRGRFLVPIADGITIAVNDRAFASFETFGANTVPGLWSNAQSAGHFIDLTKVGVFRSGNFTVPNATGGSTVVAVLEVDFTNKP
jgi:hypothetical protein